MYNLDQLPDEQLKEHFRWYWLIEARLLAELCLLKGCEAELDLHRRIQEYGHRAYVFQRNDLCDRLSDPGNRRNAYELLMERHASLLRLVEEAKKLLGDRAASIIGFAGGTVGEDMGRESRSRKDREGQPCVLPEDQVIAALPFPMHSPAEEGSSPVHRKPDPETALWEARKRGIVGLPDEALEHLARCFHEGFLRGFRGAAEVHSREHPGVDPAVLRHLRYAFPHSPPAKHDPAGR